MEVAFDVGVRRLALRVDQLPAWAFVCGAMIAFGTARAGRMIFLLRRNEGGMELFGIITLAIFLLVVIFAVRRRQVSAWRSAIQLMGALVAGNAFAILLIWPFIPEGYGLSLTPMLWQTMTAGTLMALGSLPLSIGLLWLSRRYGSHSQLTERRLRTIHETLSRKRPRRQDRSAL